LVHYNSGVAADYSNPQTKVKLPASTVVEDQPKKRLVTVHEQLRVLRVIELRKVGAWYQII